MQLYDLPTPLVLIDISKVMKNLEKYFSLSKKYGKKLWPMVKTHKSSYIAKIQREYGADGFTVGTLDEAEVLVEKGLTKTIMFGNVYIADDQNLQRVVNLVEHGCRVILRVDNLDGAVFIDSKLKSYGMKLDYVVKVDTGLHRFGVKPERVTDFVYKMQKFNNLNFVGIVTHPGHVYSSRNPNEVELIAREVSKTMSKVVEDLVKKGFELEIVGTGSTPTLKYDLEDPLYTHLFPGNFVYFDRMQAELFKVASLDDCALTVLTTVVSIPEHSEGRIAIVNAGSKLFGLDRGAHGDNVLQGFGRIVEHPKALLTRLSEEVGVVDISLEKSIRVGEKVRIVPNHACIVGNSTSYAIVHEGIRVRGIVEIDMRNGVRVPRVLSEVLMRFYT